MQREPLSFELTNHLNNNYVATASGRFLHCECAGRRCNVTESAERLARVEEKLDVLVSEMGGLRSDVKDFGTRITKLEESTREAVPRSGDSGSG